MRIQKVIFVLFLGLFIADLACAEWELWVIPDKRVVDKNESLRFRFGVSGHGYLDPHELKVTIYTEIDCPLSDKKGGELVKQEQDENHVYVYVFRTETPEDLFTKPADLILLGDPPGVKLESETNTPFVPMWVTPRSSGDKNVILILSYKTEGGTWRTVSRDFEYHVRTWREKYETFLEWFAIIAAIIGIYLPCLSKRKSSKQT